jgi:hypothetical protein
MQLRVAIVTQDTDVITATASLKRNSTEAGGVPVNAQVMQLPFNGHSWISQTALVPGAINMGAGTQKTIGWGAMALMVQLLFRWNGRGRHRDPEPQRRRAAADVE